MTKKNDLDSQKVALLILDGWGLGKNDHTNAIYQANTPFIDSIAKTYPNTTLLTHGENVGLPEGQMGNSEVGHINIGAGRIIYQELMRINKSVESGDILNQPNFQKLIQEAKGKNVHIIGLVSDGGVHSHINHITGIVKLFNENHLSNVFVHAITDGRDTDPKGGHDYVKELEECCDLNGAQLSSVIGRYYAMDRDKRWERTKLAYDLYTKAEGKKSKDILQSIKDSYQENVTDEFILPIVKVDDKNEPIATIKDGDLVFFVNFRTDRPRQLTTVLTQEEFPDQEMKPLDLDFYTMTKYDESFKGITVIFEKENVKLPIGEYLSQQGKTQIRIAETEKYPHVTFFFNGGREVEFDGEKRILVNSPKVATYDLQPEMSAHEITEKILPEIAEQTADFICLNFANTDMVGHTGDFNAAMKAAQTVDGCVKEIVTLGLEKGYQFLIIADHGNSDMMVNPDGSPNTAHTTNPVPLYYVANETRGKSIQPGILADLAPTILHLMNLEIPDVMTGKVLV